jgi:DNA-directed RNA polymerase alpha subunit
VNLLAVAAELEGMALHLRRIHDQMEKEKVKPPGTPISESGLPVRVRKALRWANVLYLEELSEMTAAQLATMRNVGNGTLELTRKKLAEQGRYLKGEGPV